MRRRIIICLALLLALCVTGSAISLLCLHGSISQFAALAESHGIQVMRANLASSAVQIETDLMAYAAQHSEHAVRDRDSVHRFADALAQCGSCHHEPVAQAQLDATRATFEGYVVAVDRLLEAEDAPEAPVLEREANLVADELTRQANVMADRAADHVSVRGSDAAASVRQAWLTLWGTLVVVLIVGGIVARHLQRRLTRPIDALLAGIQHLRDGDTQHRLSIEADEEFVALGDALNEAYESLTRAQDSVLQAEKMAAVGQLAAGVAHEVGNPLASISSIAQMMRRNNSNEEQREYIDLIMQHIGRVSQTVRELLTFSRPTQDEGWRRVDVSQVLDNAISLLKYDKRVGRARVETHYDPGLCIEKGNPDRLLLVFTNIMLNAFDALGARDEGDARLTVTARREHERVTIRFEDNGLGMSAEHIERAFEPFFSTKAPGTGTGLGLWVCYQVVEKHGGGIQINSRPGAGTTVTVSLPQGAMQAEVAAEQSAAR